MIKTNFKGALLTLAIIFLATPLSTDATTQPSCQILSRDLKLGSRDQKVIKDVTSLQNYLKSKGFLKKISGAYGGNTLTAVKKYQKVNGLPVTGKINPIDRAQINALICKNIDQAELTISLASSNPDSSIFRVEKNSSSEWYSVLKFKINAEESDITINNLPLTLAVSTSTVHNVIDDLELVIDGKTFDDYALSSDTSKVTTAIFDLYNEDVIIDADEEVTAEVRVRFSAISEYGANTNISAKITEADVDNIKAEGMDDLTAADLLGSAIGKSHTLKEVSAPVAIRSMEAEVDENIDTTSTDDEGVFVIEFDVEAFEDTAYIELDTYAGTNANPNAGVSYLIENSSNTEITTSTAISSTLTLVSGGEREENFVKIEEGQRVTLRLTVNFDPATEGDYRIQLYSVNFNDTETEEDSREILSPEQDYETATIHIDQ